MRLVRIRDGLQQGGFASVVQADAGGAGTNTGWSYLLDGVILALRWLLHPALGDEAALRWAGANIGPLSVGLLAAAAAWAVAPLCSRGWLWMAAVAVPLAPVVAAYGTLGCAHHHLPLACTVAMLAGWTGRALVGAGLRAGLQVGVWAGLGLWLSPEVTPFVLMAFGALWMGWVRRECLAMAPAAGALLAMVLIAWTIDPPLAGYQVAQIDRLSLVSVVLAALLAAMALWCHGLDRLQVVTTRRAGLGLLAALLAGGAWLTLFPALLRGPTGMLPAAQARAFFGLITEMQPALDGVADALSACLTALLAVAVAGGLALSRRSWRWGYAALCTGGAGVLGLIHWRFAIYGQLAGAMALPVALTAISRATACRAPYAGAAARLSLLAATLALPPLLLRTATASAGPPMSGRCRVRDMLPALARYPDAVILDEIDDTPELLYRTSLRPIGSWYHPGIAAFMAARAAWRSPISASVPAAVQATHATLILVCRTNAVHRDPLVADLARETLSDQLKAGAIPTWLLQVADETAGAYRLFRVMPPP